MRKALSVVAVCVGGMLSQPAVAQPPVGRSDLIDRCETISSYEERCVIGLQVQRIANLHTSQLRSEWCWAASVEMLLSHHGHSVSQIDVAQRVLKGQAEGEARLLDDADSPLRRQEPENRRVTKAELLETIPGVWIASSGRRVRMNAVSLMRSDATRAQRLDPHALVDEFRHGRPLLIGVSGHAMVLFGITFEKLGPDADAWRLTGGWVADPQIGPGTTSKSESGIRRLRPDELSPSLLLALRVRADEAD